MKRLIYLIPLVVALLQGKPSVHAQMQYTETNTYLKANAYWAWFNHIGIDWSTGVPAYDSNNLASPLSIDTIGSGRGSSSVADPYSGELLFYTQGGWIWTKNHEPMPNGTHLTGARGPNEDFAHQTLIVPMIGDSNKYYVFGRRTGPGTLGGGRDGLTYSIVDMTLNNGHGDIVSGMKDIILNPANNYSGAFAPPHHRQYETMAAIPGNNCDVWLVTVARSPYYDSFYYYAYHIDASGINSTPVISPSNLYDLNVDMRVSPDRTKLLVYGLTSDVKRMPYFDSAMASIGKAHVVFSELSRFDPETGEVSELTPFGYRKQQNFDPTALGSDFFNISSASFSPDNKKLYTVNVNFAGNEIYLTQFDVDLLDSSAISQSQMVVDSLVTYNNTFTQANAWCGVDQKSPNLKLYNDTIFVSWAHSNKIGSINKPNLSGTACELQIDYFSLPIDKLNFGRPFYEVVYPMHFDNALVLDTQSCISQILEPRVINSRANYKWSNGETGPTINGIAGREYWVTYSFLSNNCLQVYTDTFKLQWEGLNPKPQITINVDTLSTALSYSSYQWLYEGNIIPGETNSKLVVSANGNYRVLVTTAEGCSDTSEVYEVTNQINSVRDVSASAAVTIFPNPTHNVLYIQYSGSVNYRVLDVTGRDLSGLKVGKEVDLSSYEPGIYQLILLNKDGRKLGAWKISKL